MLDPSPDCFLRWLPQTSELSLWGRGAVWHELEHDQSVAVSATSDLIEHSPNFGYRAANEAAMGLGS